MSFVEWIGTIASIISFFSIIGNIIQYVHRKENSKDFRKFTQEHYNNYFYIARALTRVRNDSTNKECNDRLSEYEKECFYIRGVADSARASLIDFAREELNYELAFEHPAYPGKKDFSDAVKMGLPPELEKD